MNTTQARSPLHGSRSRKRQHEQTDAVWQSETLVGDFLSGVRGAIPLAQEQINVMLQLLASRKRPLKRFLDLGCGDGILGAAILTTHPRARGLFADFSQPMLDSCQAKLAAHARCIELLRLDYGHHNWAGAVRPHGPFDAVVSGYSIHHQPDARKRSLYREIHDLLTPGGWFVNIEHVAPACATTNALFDQAMVDSIRRLQPRMSPQTVRRRYVNRPDKAANILAPVDTQCRWLRRIGFNEVDCYFKIYELAVFGGRKELISR